MSHAPFDMEQARADLADLRRVENVDLRRDDLSLQEKRDWTFVRMSRCASHLAGALARIAALEGAAGELAEALRLHDIKDDPSRGWAERENRVFGCAYAVARLVGWTPSEDDPPTDIDDRTEMRLRAEIERLRAERQDLIGGISFPSFDDERLGYVEVQLDRDLWLNIKAEKSNLSGETGRAKEE